MSVELVLWFAGCLVFLLLILFVVRPYMLQHHEDERGDEVESESRAERDADTPS